MSADNTIGENIDCLDGSEGQSDSDNTSDQNRKSHKASPLPVKDRCGFAPRRPNAGKNAKLMDTGIHRYSKRVMDD